MTSPEAAKPATATTVNGPHEVDLLGCAIGPEATPNQAAVQALSTGSSGFADYVLAEIRCAGLRAQLALNEIEAMRIALGAGLVSPDLALEHLAEVGALHLIEASS